METLAIPAMTAVSVSQRKDLSPVRQRDCMADSGMKTPAIACVRAGGGPRLNECYGRDGSNHSGIHNGNLATKACSGQVISSTPARNKRLCCHESKRWKAQKYSSNNNKAPSSHGSKKNKIAAMPCVTVAMSPRCQRGQASHSKKAPKWTLLLRMWEFGRNTKNSIQAGKRKSGQTDTFIGLSPIKRSKQQTDTLTCDQARLRHGDTTQGCQKKPLKFDCTPFKPNKDWSGYDISHEGDP